MQIMHEAAIIKTDPSSMTAPQLSVDTVNESVSNTNILQKSNGVNSIISENAENDCR